MFKDQEYNERRSSFDWKKLLVRVVLILVLVFLLIWGFSMINPKSNNKKTEQLVDQTYTENLENMKNGAKGYFTIPRLPKNVGDKVTLTLSELLELNLVLPFTDSSGNPCDNNASYVEIERFESEYKLTTVLVCGEETRMLVEYLDLECDLSCDNSCVKEEPTVDEEVPATPDTPVVPTPQVNKITEYRYRRANPTGNWTDWSAWSETYIKGDDNKQMVQYMGKRWTHNLVYNYEFSKLIPSTTTCNPIFIPGGTFTEKVCEDVYKQTGSTYVSDTCSATVPGACREVSYVIGTESVRQSDGTYKSVTNYGTRTECEPSTTETWECGGYEPTYDWVSECNMVTETRPDRTDPNCTTTPERTETTWSTSAVLAGWTATGQKVLLRDDGYYSYSSWAVLLPEGYELHSTRTLYSYRNYVTKEDYEYMWSTSNNIGNGWEFTGETRSKEIVIY